MHLLVLLDPGNQLTGFMRSSRGGNAMTFGKDITESFLKLNKLDLLVRSHQVAQEGIQLKHGGNCITVFSAPNYCDEVGNKGAILRFHHNRPARNPEVITFNAVPHPYLSSKVNTQTFGLF
jgi:serine/threonine-protein phosphatase 5